MSNTSVFNKRSDMPDYLKDFLFYLEIIKGRSFRTVDAYYIDIRAFLRFIKMQRSLGDESLEFSEIEIADIPISIIQDITLNDVHEFLHYVSNVRNNSAKTRARKASSLRVFFDYLNKKTELLPNNPVTELEFPTPKKSLPKYLSLEQAIELLATVDGPYAERDYCILTLFLNCGLRLSELVGINCNDFSENTLRVIGKGNKERIIYVNDACKNAVEDYLPERPKIKNTDALFISRNGNRISRRRVQEIVENALKKCGLGNAGFSTHKLRHTAATLMYQHGNVDVRILKEILGHENLATTEIYTHVSNDQMAKAMSDSPLSKIHKKAKKE
ncbi:MAG: tyrosine recombinase XerC [Clostridiales bacterium]|nr:tyrosine recombinase XerC [Clostridiales bacterium]